MTGGGIAGRAEALPPFIAMEVLERAQDLERKGEHVVHLELREIRGSRASAVSLRPELRPRDSGERMKG